MLRALQSHAVALCPALRGGACIEAAHLHAYMSALGPGFASSIVLCVLRLVPNDVLDGLLPNSVPLVHTLAMACTCVEPVSCIRDDRNQVT